MEVLPSGSDYWTRNGAHNGAFNADGSSAADVGAFTQGTAASRWALGRYLLGRALALQVNRVLLVIAALVVAIAVGAWFAHLTVLAVLIGLIAVVVLITRAGLGAILRRLTFVSLDPHAESQLAKLVASTRKDVARELRRLGLPSRTLTMPLLAIRLAGRHRGEVLTRLRVFDVARVVPGARLDELHLLLDGQGRRGGPIV